MFTILAKACTVAACIIISGPVDWSKPHSGDLIEIAGVQILLRAALDYGDEEYQAKGGKLIKEIVGSKPLVCKGEFGSHGKFIKAKCYFVGRHGTIVNVAEEMHKRGF